MSDHVAQDGRNEGELMRLALDHCMFPLADNAQVRRDGPTIYVAGEGAELVETGGRRVLDMMSSHTRANTLGYGNREIAQAVYDQMVEVHYVGTVANFAPSTVRLAARLAELAPGRLSRTMFVSGGSEAVEAALKLARQYHVASGRKPRAYKVVSRWNAYHGSTMGALAVTDWLGTRHIMEPGVPGSSLIPGPMRYRNPFGMAEEAYADFCADYLERQIQHEGPEYVSAFIGEPIMQANGVQIPTARYLQRVREICTRYDVLYIVDEVITGFGRTGKWFAIEHFGIEPDIMTMAKALTAGYVPMGAVITRPDIADAMPMFRHVHTFSGHAAAAAAANAAIGIVAREGLVEAAAAKGARFLASLKTALAGIPAVGDVRGVGLWLAVDFTADPASKAPPPEGFPAEVVRRMAELGMIACSTGTSIELAPPLIVTDAQLDRAAGIAG
ncbi:MAG: aspartate aminotransferase family protein, partial [Alphaproteobacteria bacterium]